MAQTSRIGALLQTYRTTASAVGIVVAVAAVTGIWMPADAWGALGQWAGAAGTVLAVMIALRIAHREAATDADRARFEKAEGEINQARLVTAELVYPDPDDISPYGIEYASAVRITNHSTTHVFHPRVEGFVHQNGGTTTWDIVTEPEEGGGYDRAPTVLPAGKHDVVPVFVTYEPEITPEMYPIRTQPIVGFTDAAGRRWRRYGSATPLRVAEDDDFQVGGSAWYRAEPN